jgi:hypothetical protein
MLILIGALQALRHGMMPDEKGKIGRDTKQTGQEVVVPCMM